MKNNGFTLVELAIVIVIIGLLVGGVLQGQELINQAKIRSQIKQLEAFDAGTLTFKAKYGWIPADIPLSQRPNFGFIGVSGTNRTGNNVLDDSTGILPNVTAYNEGYIFFTDLSTAKLIKEYIRHLGNNYSVDITFPKASLVDAGVAAVGLTDGLYWFIGPTIKNNTANLTYYSQNSTSPSLIPSDAGQLDMKIDDGNPTQGIVRAILITSTNATNFINETATGGATNCLGSSTSVYNLNSNQPLCRLVIKSKAN